MITRVAIGTRIRLPGSNYQCVKDKEVAQAFCKILLKNGKADERTQPQPLGPRPFPVTIAAGLIRVFHFDR